MEGKKRGQGGIKKLKAVATSVVIAFFFRLKFSASYLQYFYLDWAGRNIYQSIDFVDPQPFIHRLLTIIFRSAGWEILFTRRQIIQKPQHLVYVCGLTHNILCLGLAFCKRID
jgi:hypothetical protein